MSQKMHVLIIPTWYPSGEDKLMGIYHKQMAQALSARKDCKVNILFVERRRLRNPLAYLFMKKRIVEHNDGYDTIIFRMLNLAPVNFAWQQKRYVHTLDKAYRYYQKHYGRPDLFHAQVTLPAGYAAALVGKKYQIPVLVTEHCGSFEKFFEGELAPYGDVVLQNATFSAVSQYMLKELKQMTGSEGYQLPNLVDCKSFDHHHIKSKSGTCRVTVLCALREGKHVGDAISAVKSLHDDGRIPNIRLTVVGDGYLREKYEMDCHILDADALVNFVGQKSHEEIARLLQHTDILLIASDVESFAIPGIEALAAGVPVVSTRCKGPEEFITFETGALCHVRNIRDMADAICRVWNHRESYDRQTLQEMASRYDSKTVANEAMELYHRVIDQANEKAEQA